MRTTVALSVLVASLLLAPVAVAAAPGLAGAVGAADAQDEGNDSYAPGERVAGAIGTEQAELDGEVAERSFGEALAAADDNASAAAVVGQRLDRVEARLDALEARNESLHQRYENGSISRGAYAAQVAVIEAERASLQRQLNASETAANRLPADTLEANGVNAGAIDELRTRASELGGPRTAELARSIAGPGVGNGVGPHDRGPGEIPGVGGREIPGQGPPDDVPGHSDNGNETDDGSGDDYGEAPDDETADGGDDSTTADGADSSGDEDDATSAGETSGAGSGSA